MHNYLELRQDTLEYVTKRDRDIYEIMQSNRSVFEFPESFDLDPFLVDDYKLPTIRKTFFGEKYDDLQINFRDLVGPSSLHRMLINPKNIDAKNFRITYALLDPTLCPIRGIVYEIDKVKSIDFNTNKNKNTIFTFNVTFKVKKITVLSLYKND